VAMPTATNLTDYLGGRISGITDTGQAAEVIKVCAALCSAYTRGNGFLDGIPNAEIAAVIIGMAARVVGEPRQMAVYEVHGPSAISASGSPMGFSTSDRIVLNRYRVTAQ